jgi:hypothetical protein
MNIKKLIAIITIIGVTSLFSSSLKKIDRLVDKINNSKNNTQRQELMNKLNNDMDSLNQRDYYEAQIIIRGNLKSFK